MFTKVISIKPKKPFIRRKLRCIEDRNILTLINGFLDLDIGSSKTKNGITYVNATAMLEFLGRMMDVQQRSWQENVDAVPFGVQDLVNARYRDKRQVLEHWLKEMINILSSTIESGMIWQFGDTDMYMINDISQNDVMMIGNAERIAKQITTRAAWSEKMLATRPEFIDEHRDRMYYYDEDEFDWDLSRTILHPTGIARLISELNKK